MGMTLDDNIRVRWDRHPGKSMVDKQGFAVGGKGQSIGMAWEKEGSSQLP